MAEADKAVLEVRGLELSFRAGAGGNRALG
jgi:hypothetical protein